MDWHYTTLSKTHFYCSQLYCRHRTWFGFKSLDVVGGIVLTTPVGGRLGGRSERWWRCRVLPPLPFCFFFWAFIFTRFFTTFASINGIVRNPPFWAFFFFFFFVSTFATRVISCLTNCFARVPFVPVFFLFKCKWFNYNICKCIFITSPFLQFVWLISVLSLTLIIAISLLNTVLNIINIVCKLCSYLLGEKI